MNDEEQVGEALKVLEGLTGNRSDDQFVWAAQEAFERALRAAEQRGFNRGYTDGKHDALHLERRHQLLANFIVWIFIGIAVAIGPAIIILAFLEGRL